MAHVVGNRRPGARTYVRCEEPVPFTKRVETRAGRLLAGDRVGFAHLVTLGCPSAPLPEAGKLRIMKAFSLSLDKALEPVGADGRWRIGIQIDPSGGMGEARISVRGRRLEILLPGGWVGRNNGSMRELRLAAQALVESKTEAIGGRKTAGGGSTRTPGGQKRAKVLLFRNIIAEPRDRAGMRQVYPVIQYLASSLSSRGMEVVLVDTSIRLPDTNQRPGDVNDRISGHDLLTDPGELDAALAAHPDLDLVCLTLLEAGFGQVRNLTGYIRERTRAFIAVGGAFPTAMPEHCFSHLPLANLIVRGDGEEVLPRLASLVAGRTIDDGLDESRIEALGELDGVLARCGELSVSSGIDRINRVMDLDEPVLDFSLLERNNVKNGLVLCTSRGCTYTCRFCLVTDKKLWRARSTDAVMADLEAYSRRIEEIYGRAGDVPAGARFLEIRDNDFFIDRQRAAELLGRMTEAGFTTTYLQGTVSSFFVRKGRRITEELDEELLDAIPRDFFVGNGGLKLGTDNFCDRELRRLGKSYDFGHIRKLVMGLSRRGLRQEHFLILFNRQTTLDDLLDNLERITELRWMAGEGFCVLAPSWLITPLPTALYRARLFHDTELELPNAGVLREAGYPELDYPFVLPERPARREVFEVARRFPASLHFGAAGAQDMTYEGIYTDEDRDFLRVFENVRGTLEKRMGELEDGGGDVGESFRIRAALAGRLGGRRWLPAGLLGRIAPGLDHAPRTLEGPSRIAGYLESLLDEAKESGELHAGFLVGAVEEGATLVVQSGGTRVEFLVLESSRDTACAFSTRNLAFVVRSSPGDADARRGASSIIESIRRIVVERDRHDLG